MIDKAIQIDDLTALRALFKVFLNINYSQLTSNTFMEDVLVKVSTLNDFYRTNIFAAYKVAKHIISLDIDE